MWNSYRKNEDVLKEISMRGIQWRFNVPAAPWQGGFYERLVGSVKRAFFKTVENKLMSWDDLVTTIKAVEGALNMRPLTQVNDRIAESLESPVIRPIDFLLPKGNIGFEWEGKSREEKEDPTYGMEKLELKTQAQAEKFLESAMKIQNEFWRRWKREYLLALMDRELNFKIEVRPKEMKTFINKRRTLEIGEIVLIMNDNESRSKWPLAKVVAIDSGRSVQLKKLDGSITSRTLNRIVHLEMTTRNKKGYGFEPEVTQSESRGNAESFRPGLRMKRRVDYAKLAGDKETEMDKARNSSFNMFTSLHLLSRSE